MNLLTILKRPSLVFTALGLILVLAVACSPAGPAATSQPGQETTGPGQPEPPVSTPVGSLPTATLEVATGNVSFSKNVLPIFEANCTTCHGASRQSSNLMLNSYTNLMAGGLGGLVIQPGNAQESELFQKISTGSMPRGGSKLSDIEIQIITDWINAGAIDN
jgi:cytochrome c553